MGSLYVLFPRLFPRSPVATFSQAIAFKCRWMEDRGGVAGGWWWVIGDWWVVGSRWSVAM